MSGVWTYAGADSISCTITDAIPGNTYRLRVEDGTFTDQSFVVAVSSTVAITVTGIHSSTLRKSRCHVRDLGTAGAIHAGTVIEKQIAGEYGYEANWSFNGTDEVTVTFNSILDLHYDLIFINPGLSSGSQGGSGSGGVDVYTATLPNALALKSWAYLYSYEFPEQNWTCRLFEPGVSGEGTLGNPLTPIAMGNSLISFNFAG